jgi:uncharacterized repeat protein (TIGR02543 family)
MVSVLGNSGALVKTGYTFAGWNSFANGSGTAQATASTFAMGTNNVTLYAQWTLIPTYTVSTVVASNGSINPASQIVNLGDTTSFAITSNPGYTSFASGCGGNLSVTTYTTGIISGNCVVSVKFFQNATSVNIATGWNLLGNSINAPLVVASVFADSSKVITVWKWIPTTNKWAFYSPLFVDAQALAAYADGKGYELLSSIEGGEGFWVNSKDTFTIQLPLGNAILSANFADQQPPLVNKLPQGWSLISVGDSPSPREFVNAIATAQPDFPNVAATGLVSLWTWNSMSWQWYFYSPSLDNSGMLTDYIANKSYLDFIAHSQLIDPALGFWVNHQ